MKSYELHLPVFKQGSDLGHAIQQNPGDLRAAFEEQASRYDAAAQICRRMAGVAAETPDLEIQADTHYIGVSGPSDRLDSLVREDFLSVTDYGDEEDWEEGDDDDVDDDDDLDEVHPEVTD